MTVIKVTSMGSQWARAFRGPMWAVGGGVWWRIITGGYGSVGAVPGFTFSATLEGMKNAGWEYKIYDDSPDEFYQALAMLALTGEAA